MGTTQSLHILNVVSLMPYIVQESCAMAKITAQ